MKKNYTAPQAELTCFEPWENVAWEDLFVGTGSNGGGFNFKDLWGSKGPNISGGSLIPDDEDTWLPI